MALPTASAQCSTVLSLQLLFLVALFRKRQVARRRYLFHLHVCFYLFICFIVAMYVHHLGLRYVLFCRVLIYRIDVALQLTKL